MPGKIKTDLGFADLVCRESDIPRVSKLARQAYSFNRKFFGTDLKKPFHIVICYSRKELDKQWGGKTKEWLTGLANEDTIATFPGPLIRKHNPKRWASLAGTLKHEINHMFFHQLTSHYTPSWLMEGLACQFGLYRLDAQDKRKLKGKRPHLIESTADGSFFKKSQFLYPMGYLAVRYLMRKHGKARMLRLLARYSKKPTKSGFDTAFQKTFGYSVKELEERVFG